MSIHEGISVSELNQIISDGIRRESRLRNVTVTAEISGFKHHLASGHWYFTLKDRAASISGVMFRQNTFHATLLPRDGDLVTVTGYVEMFARDGKVQFYALSMKAAGIGSLYEQFEAIKRKLNEEGLFAPERKKVLPLFPAKVAVITSASGAALHDVLNVSGLRNPGIPVVLVPSSVQGPDAPAELISALKKAEQVTGVEVIIICRGGGSQEDLWCFNDEYLARAIAACPIPVVSGVGHETDFTICDYVSDYRASTPSNAAEIVFPDRSELKNRIHLLESALSRAFREKVHDALLDILALKERLQHLSPDQVIHFLLDQSHQYSRNLERAVSFLLQEKSNELNQTRSRLCYGMDILVRSRLADVRHAQARLNAISPVKVLERGYALVYDPVGHLLPDAETAGKKNEMKIQFRDGMIEAYRKETR